MMLNRAAIAYAKLYSIEMARQNGFEATHPHLQASQAADRVADLTQNVFDHGLQFAKLNKSLMSQLQADSNDTETECFEKTAALNAQILAIFDIQPLILSGLDSDKVLH